MAINEQALSSDEEELHRLGYAQELRRRMSGFSNFAVSFTIISILSGCLTLYGYGMNTGGPAIIVWGWPIVGLMTLMVGPPVPMPYPYRVRQPDRIEMIVNETAKLENPDMRLRSSWA